MFVHEKSAKIHSTKSTPNGDILCIRGVENKVKLPSQLTHSLISQLFNQKLAYSKYAGSKNTLGNK